MEERLQETLPIESVPTSEPIAEPTESTIYPETDGGEGLCVVFNREQRRLSPQEAVSYAQQGLKWEQFAPTYRKLRFVSEQLGGSVGEIIDGLLDCCEQQEWEALAAAHPDEPLLAAQLFAAAKQEREQQWGKAPVGVSEEERLAGEYAALCAEIPDAPAFEALPTEMWEVAEKEDVPLLDAYLRVLFREQRRVAEEANAQQAAAARSAGSMRSEADDPDTAGEAFRRALTRAM